MKNWMDLNVDGKIDSTEMMFLGKCFAPKQRRHEAYLEMPETLGMIQKRILRWMLWQQDLILVN